MTKLDFRKTDKAFYAAPSNGWQEITLPVLTFLMIDGAGDPNGPGYAAALGALYPMAYGVKFARKAIGADFVVPPLEALWWAQDMDAFTTGDRGDWRWTAMLRMPDDLKDEEVEDVCKTVLRKQARKTDGAPAELLTQVRLEHYAEGPCLQHLHHGPFTDEAPVLADLHHRVMPDMGLTFGGHHHEIYLSDPRRVAPNKLKTILRQPVKPIGAADAGRR